MKLGYIIIYVPDVELALQFYEQAFGLKQSFLHESMQYGEIEMGSTKLAFASEAIAELNGVQFVKNRLDNHAPGIEIALVTPDVSEAFNRAVKGGAIALAEPMNKPWGQTVSYVRDLNGVLIEICSPMAN
ncbi:MAG: VOC family protein [Gammaproteobacteria bacterium]|nr:VOC family protein [Gammaproteobacteria bacterium]